VVSSFALFQFFEQLLFQMATRGLFNRTPLGSHGFFLCMAFSSRPALCGTWQVRNLRSLRTDFSLLRFRIGIHEETLKFLIRDKKDGDSSKLKDDREHYHGQDRLVVQQPHHDAP
jgi:hypothetical protein